MQRLSSKLTFMQKRVFPAYWFVFTGLFMCIGLYNVIVRHRLQALAFIIVPAFLAVFGYVMMKKLILDLVDEMWDEGDALIAKNRGESYRIDLANIMNVSYTPLMNPPRVTLTLRDPCELGREVTFSAPHRLLGKDPLIQNLVERIDAIRHR